MARIVYLQMQVKFFSLLSHFHFYFETFCRHQLMENQTLKVLCARFRHTRVIWIPFPPFLSPSQFPSVNMESAVAPLFCITHANGLVSLWAPSFLDVVFFIKMSVTSTTQLDTEFIHFFCYDQSLYPCPSFSFTYKTKYPKYHWLRFLPYLGNFKHESYDDGGLKQCFEQFFLIGRWLKVINFGNHTPLALILIRVFLQLNKKRHSLVQHSIHSGWHFEVNAKSWSFWYWPSTSNPWKLRFFILVTTCRMRFHDYIFLLAQLRHPGTSPKGRAPESVNSNLFPSRTVNYSSFSGTVLPFLMFIGDCVVRCIRGQVTRYPYWDW